MPGPSPLNVSYCAMSTGGSNEVEVGDLGVSYSFLYRTVTITGVDTSQPLCITIHANGGSGPITIGLGSFQSLYQIDDNKLSEDVIAVTHVGTATFDTVTISFSGSSVDDGNFTWYVFAYQVSQ